MERKYLDLPTKVPKFDKTQQIFGAIAVSHLSAVVPYITIGCG